MLKKSRRGNVMKMGAGAAQANSEKQAMRAVATATRMAAETGADDAAALKKLAKQAGEAAQLLKLLGNEKRLLVLCFLAAALLAVCAGFAADAQTVSPYPALTIPLKIDQVPGQPVWYSTGNPGIP